MSSYQQKTKNKYTALSTSMKKVAKYLLEQPQLFAMKSATEIGNDVGVSETTVIRFCHALEYVGFSELQKEVRQSLIFAESSLQKFEKDKEDMGTGPRLYREAMNRDQIKIQKMLEQIEEEDIHLAVQQIIKSDFTLVAGMRTSFAAAYWLSFTLNLVKGNAKLFQPGTDDILYLLSKMKEGKSTFIGISFHRYASETIKLAETVKKQGSFVIAISDSPVSPISEFADIHLPVQIPVQSTIDTAPALFSLLNAIISGVSVHDNKNFKKQRENYESLHLNDFFFRGE